MTGTTTTRDTPPVPPPPPFALSTDIEGPDEHDVDLDDEDDLDLPEPPQDDEDTRVEAIEFVGTYPSVIAYFRAMLEPEIGKGVLWILDCLDYEKVSKRFTDNGRYRYVQEGGAIYRVGMRANPTPPPGEDPPGPSMPTRGC